MPPSPQGEGFWQKIHLSKNKSEALRASLLKGANGGADMETANSVLTMFGGGMEQVHSAAVVPLTGLEPVTFRGRF